MPAKAHPTYSSQLENAAGPSANKIIGPFADRVAGCPLWLFRFASPSTRVQQMLRWQLGLNSHSAMASLCTLGPCSLPGSRKVLDRFAAHTLTKDRSAKPLHAVAHWMSACLKSATTVNDMFPVLALVSRLTGKEERADSDTGVDVCTLF